MPMLSILSDLNRSSNSIQASAIITKDGLVLASLMPENVNEDKLGSMTAALFSVGSKSSREFSGVFEQIVLSGSNGYILINQAGKEACLTVITEAHAELETLFSTLKCSAQKITSYL